MPEDDDIVTRLRACPDYLTIPVRRAAEEIEHLRAMVNYLCNWLDGAGIVDAGSAREAAENAVGSRHAR